MRISFLSPGPNLAGGERVVAIYAQKLAERGHEVRIICSRPDQPRLRHRIKSVLTGNGWPGVSETQASHFADYGVNYQVLDRCGPIENRDVPDGDVVVATFWPTALAAIRLGKTKGALFYLVQHDEGRVFSNWPEAESTYQLPMQQICVSRWIADEVLRRHPGARQIVINNAVEADRFSPPTTRRPREARIGFLHSPAAWKRSDLAIKAMELARQELPNLDAESLSEAKPKNIPEWIVQNVQPEPKKLAALYGRCRSWLFCSDYEGFGLPILEAMACGTPVVGTPAGAAPELIGQGGGILVPHDDPAAMADAIVRICRMPDDQWQVMSDAAYGTATSYTWDNATDLFEAALMNALHQIPKQTYTAVGMISSKQ